MISEGINLADFLRSTCIYLRAVQLQKLGSKIRLRLCAGKRGGGGFCVGCGRCTGTFRLGLFGRVGVISESMPV